MTVDIELFDQVALFEGLDQDALQKVAETSKLITIPDATYFINENEDTHNIFVINKGRVIVEIAGNSPDENKEIARLRKGDTVGEFNLAKQILRSASVRSYGEVELVECEKKKILELFDQEPRVGLTIYRNLCQILVDRARDTTILARNALSSMR
ncbi:MAG: hypothetical protein CMP10_09345 [Zetaproteobacteria bacterium]|nr:hypothetical protein [Pseudobdellovibrionaceae bacterium]